MLGTSSSGFRGEAHTRSHARVLLVFVLPPIVSPYIDTQGPSCRPRLAIAPGKGSYVKVVDREGKQGKKMVIVGTIGILREMVEVYNLDVGPFTVVRAFEDGDDAGDGDPLVTTSSTCGAESCPVSHGDTELCAMLVAMLL